VTHIEMCSFLHGSDFFQCLRYRRGSPAFDPQPGGEERPLQKSNVCTPCLFVCDNFEQGPGHRTRGYGEDAGHRLSVLRQSKALRGTWPAQSSTTRFAEHGLAQSLILWLCRLYADPRIRSRVRAIDEIGRAEAKRDHVRGSSSMALPPFAHRRRVDCTRDSR